MSEEYGKHYSVMYRECLEAFKNSIENDNPIFADMTFGAGGHTFRMAKLTESAICYSVDQDPDAIKNGNTRIAEENLQDKVNLIYTNYESFPKWVAENKPELKFTGILMDLGVSSHQFDTFERGFSFRSDAPLDMRMDYKNDDVETAADILNNYDEEDIANLIFKYGEERLSRRIAAEIVERRKEEPITRTKQLEDICFHAYPKKMRFGKTHPATRTFQALRIAVNDELGVLENTLQGLFDILDVGGTLAVISFHSLEDRIVKHKFKEIFQTDKNIAKILSKRPILPSEDEVLENKRSRSAKLRLIKKLG
jgi:16S rRNA (cytosine1402-N4)-methyltransferase